MQFVVNVDKDTAAKFDPKKFNQLVTDAVTNAVKAAIAQAEKDQGVKDGSIVINVAGKPDKPGFKLPKGDDDAVPVGNGQGGFKLPKGD